ncbi:hypothetical protein OSTOST_01767, partial [Ostertagia ostertagi]
KSAGSEATQNISALIKQGKKKKRNVKFNTSEREYLNRNVNAARSFRSKSSYGAGFVHPLREAFFTNSQQAVLNSRCAVSSSFGLPSTSRAVVNKQGNCEKSCD